MLANATDSYEVHTELAGNGCIVLASKQQTSVAVFLYKGYKQRKATFFVAFFILYIIILSGISCGQGDRFHLVTFPFVILLLAKFLSETKLFKPFFEPLQK